MVKIIYNDKLVYKVVIWAFLELVYEQRKVVLSNVCGGGMTITTVPQTRSRLLSITLPTQMMLSKRTTDLKLY